MVSLGEVHWLAAYVRQDRSIYDPEHGLLCTCGRSVSECPFWTAVEARVGRPLDALLLRQRLRRLRRGNRFVEALRHIPRKLIKNHPVLYRHAKVRALFDGQRVGHDSIALYDAVCSVTGRPFCVDSSKSPYRFRDAFALDSTRTFAIVLSRDYRAVIYSKMKRGDSLGNAALRWRLRMEQIRALTSDLPGDRVHRITYEALCEDPGNTFRGLCGFIGVEFEESMLRRVTGDVHHLGGSPSKLDPGRVEISLDRSHENRFSVDELERMREIVGDVALEWGY